jgi:hypothetical protein
LRLLLLSLLACCISGCVVTHPLPGPDPRLNFYTAEKYADSEETTQIQVLPSGDSIDYGITTQHIVSLIRDDTKPPVTQVIVIVSYDSTKMSLEGFQASEWGGAVEVTTYRYTSNMIAFIVDLDPNSPGYPPDNSFSIFRVTWKAEQGLITHFDYTLSDITYQ